MLHFNDGSGWTERRIDGVISAYKIPSGVSGVAIDVGANVGAFSIVNHQKFARIISIEPALETYQRCLDTVNRFKYNNVEVHNLAVHKNTDEIVKIRHYKDAAYSGNATTLDDPKWYNPNEYEEVKTISIEGIFEKFGLTRINYLKVDCEGAEYDFLMNKDLTKIDFIGIEVHIHIAEKGLELMEYIEKTHDVIHKQGDGRTSHYEVTYKLK